MKASELIKELQRCIDKHGDLVVKYDEFIEVEGAKVCNPEWTADIEENKLLAPDRILLNEHKAYGCIE